MKLLVNNKAPAFSAPDQSDIIHTLADYRGQWLLLYFYPKDDTPGCTTEACSLRDSLPNFKKLDLAVLGVSVDSVGSHEKFSRKYRLTFPLLADADKKIVNAYGVWRKKKMMGRTYDGTVRTSFLIDPDGRIAKIYEPVKPLVHAGQVLEDLATLTH